MLEYLDFYKQAQNGQKSELKYLVFDSKFTNYENLAKLDGNNVKFVTIRRRGKNIIEEIAQIEKDKWQTIRVECAGNKTRVLKVHERIVHLKGYGKEIREIIITGHGRKKPAIIITNEDDVKAEKMISNSGSVAITDKTIELTLKKKRTMPILLDMMKKYDQTTYPWLFNKPIIFSGASTL